MQPNAKLKNNTLIFTRVQNTWCISNTLRSSCKFASVSCTVCKFQFCSQLLASGSLTCTWMNVSCWLITTNNHLCMTWNSTQNLSRESDWLQSFVSLWDSGLWEIDKSSTIGRLIYSTIQWQWIQNMIRISVINGTQLFLVWDSLFMFVFFNLITSGVLKS